jgi:hypothetical protein
MSFHPLRGGFTFFHPLREEGYTFFHPYREEGSHFFIHWERRVTHSFHPLRKEGYTFFSSIERGGLHIFFIHLQAGYRTFQPRTRGLRHALEVTIFHPLRGGLHNFSSIYKLIMWLFIHRKEGYGVTVKLQWTFCGRVT